MIDEIEKDSEISDFTATDLQSEILGPKIIGRYRKEVSKRMKSDIKMNILAGYFSSVFQDLECYLRTEIDFVEEDIRSVSDEYSSCFITDEITPSSYKIKDLSEVLLRSSQLDFDGFNSSIDIDFNVFSMKTTLVVRCDKIAKRFDEKSFFSSMLGLKSYCGYKHYDEYINQQFIHLRTIDKCHLKCDAIDGFVVNLMRESIFCSFALINRMGIKKFRQLETIHHKKLNKSVLNITTFYLEDESHEELILMEKHGLLHYS